MASPTAQTILATEFSVIPTTTVVRNSPQVIALNPVLAIVGKTKLVPAARGHAQLPAAEHRDLHQRERGAGRLQQHGLGAGRRPGGG